jgi:drug/metabolite transporter (DMT)-like permease
MMTSLRHLAFFLALGTFWGISPSLYGHWGDIGMPVSHVLVMTGFGVGLMLVLFARTRGIDWWGGVRLQLFGAGCAGLLAVSFGLGLVFARHVPPTELALAISTSPIVNYLVALVTGRENAAPRRLLAILLGFVSTAILVVTREGMLQGSVSWWLIATFLLPFLYAAYNFFAADYWPDGAHPMAAGAAESVWLGVFALPFLLLLAPLGGAEQPPLWAYWTILFACGMWTVERIAFFTLIREKGAVYTIQAVYLSTPAAVLIATAVHGGADLWLFAALAILMAALYFNNTGAAARPQTQSGAPSAG